ncbi:alpha/beta fold hydrolase [Geodermatophilus sp. URMC 63]
MGRAPVLRPGTRRHRRQRRPPPRPGRRRRVGVRSDLSVPVTGGSLVGAVEDGTHDAAAPLVLLLHGGPGASVESLAGLERKLLPRARVATFQQRGLAPSTTEGPFDLTTAVDDVRAVLDGLREPGVVLAGHSWGAHLALAVAARGRLPRGRLAAVLCLDLVPGVTRGRWPAAVPGGTGRPHPRGRPPPAGRARAGPRGGPGGRTGVRGAVRPGVAGLRRLPVGPAADARRPAGPRGVRAAAGGRTRRAAAARGRAGRRRRAGPPRPRDRQPGPRDDREGRCRATAGRRRGGGGGRRSLPLAGAARFGRASAGPPPGAPARSVSVLRRRLRCRARRRPGRRGRRAPRRSRRRASARPSPSAAHP